MTVRADTAGVIAPADLPDLERARRTQECDRLCVAGVHALTGLPRISRRGRHWYDDGTRLFLPAPTLHVHADIDGWTDFRGAADGVAGSLLLTDRDLFAEQCPGGVGLAAVIFAVLEQVRVEHLLPRELPGMRRNVAQRHEHWVRQFIGHGLSESERALHVLAVDLTARVHVLGAPLDDDVADLVEATRWGLAGEIGADLRALRRLTEDQRRYGVVARRIAEAVAARLPEGHGRSEDEADEGLESASGFSLLAGFEADESVPRAASGHSRALDESAGGYRVHTHAYDEVRAAESLARPDLLRRHRQDLDELVRSHAPSVPGLARTLHALLSTPVDIAWQGHQPSGVVDGKRLAGLVADPADRHVFRRPTLRTTPSTSVSILLDLSGSMRGHAPYVAVLVDTLCRALDRIGAVNEVLGFTTSSWRGGRSRAAWEAGGRPPHPGRLADLRHVVLKSSTARWRHSRESIAAILVPEIYKEGVDGEALRWAADRARSLDAERHLVISVSDGSPSERSTALTNDEHYLGQHLRQVVDETNRRPGFAVVALGLGLDLSPYHDHARVVHDTQVASVHSGLADLLALLRG